MQKFYKIEIIEILNSQIPNLKKMGNLKILDNDCLFFSEKDISIVLKEIMKDIKVGKLEEDATALRIENFNLKKNLITIEEELDAISSGIKTISIFSFWQRFKFLISPKKIRNFISTKLPLRKKFK